MTSACPQKIGILAGGGDLPKILLSACEQSGVECVVVAFEGHADHSLFAGHASIQAKLGQAGKVIKFFKQEKVQDIVLIGSIHRPSVSELMPDLKATKFFAKYAFRAMGDSDLLSSLRRFLHDEGFTVRGIQDFVPDILTPEGVLTKHKPSQDDWLDIRRGVDVLLSMAPLDIGQAVIVQEGLVLSVEAIEGTSALIERSAPLRRKGRKGVLVKLCKSQQDTALDLPTVGLDTLRSIYEAGFGGIVIHAHKSLMVNRDDLVSFADKHHLYIIGIDPDA